MGKARTGPAQRRPRKVSRRYLENAALFYLGRYDAPARHLNLILERKVARSVRAHGTDPAEGRAWAAEVVEKLISEGWLDDARYARNAPAGCSIPASRNAPSPLTSPDEGSAGPRSRAHSNRWTQEPIPTARPSGGLPAAASSGLSGRHSAPRRANATSASWRAPDSAMPSPAQ